MIKEHSIGFQYIQDKMNFVEDDTIPTKGYNEIKELKLWEGSAVTFGSNPFTHVVDIKGQDRLDQIQKIQKELDACIRALSNGKGSDERLYDYEMKVKFLSSQLVLLASRDPVQDQSKEDKPADHKKAFDWSQVMTSLNTTKQSFSDYPEQAKQNARRGIELNDSVNNSFATAVGKQRAHQIANSRPLTLDVLKRTYSFLNRAETYYNPEDPTTCGTISYLLWGGKEMLVYAERKLAEIENNNLTKI